MATSLVGNPFWVRQNIDTRGRLNPLPHFHYNRADHIRGLFRFAKGEPVGEDGIRWLKIAAANAFNADKQMTRRTFDQRVAWTDEHLDAIRDVALCPMDRLPWLRLASDPIQFVALAIELTNALAEGATYISSLPIGFDASCNGAQHLSLLARDLNGANLTNLVPNEAGKVECIYDAVRRRVSVQVATDDVIAIQAANDGLWMISGDFPEGRYASWWNKAAHIDRAMTKMLVMTHFYGSEEGGKRLNIYEELFDRGFAKEQISKGAVFYLIKAVEKAINAELEGGAPAIMNFLRKIARALAEKSLPAEWISPSGLPVFNLYQKALRQRRCFG